MNKLKTYWFWLLSGSAILLLAFAIFLYKSDKYTWADWTGFGEDITKSEEKTFQNGKLTITKNTTQYQSGKTLWDWLGLAGVIAIPIILYQFQHQQQKRSEEQAEVEKKQAQERADLEREIAATNLREEALQNYLDRMAGLLIDKELKKLLTQSSRPGRMPGMVYEDDPKIDAILDIARAITLSILRQLNKDGERKGSVVHFLIDAELVKGLKLLENANLSGANLSKLNLLGVNFKGANFSGANLSEADFSEADLSEADLSGANLSKAKLYRTDLSGANLSKAKLYRTELPEANLSGADFSEAKLYGANLYGADLSKANVSGASFSGADLSVANLSGANLEGANFSQNDAIEVYLEMIYFYGIKPSGANLSGSNLSGAGLYGANLSEANLSGANLKGAKNLFLEGLESPEPKQIQAAKNWEQAIYDPEFREQLGLPPETTP